MARNYDDNFKAMLVNFIVMEKYSTAKIAEMFDIPLKTLEGWITIFNKSAKDLPFDSSLESQLLFLQKRVNALSKEAEILKKSLSFLAEIGYQKSVNEDFGLNIHNPKDIVSFLAKQYKEEPSALKEDLVKDEENEKSNKLDKMLNKIKRDHVLDFLEEESKKTLIPIGTITHSDEKALDILYNKVVVRGNPNNKFGFLYFEEEHFLALMKYNGTLVLVVNDEYVSPMVLIRGLCLIIRIIYDELSNTDFLENYFLGPNMAKAFKLTGLNVKVLSALPKVTLDKMTHQRGIFTYQTENMKVKYNQEERIEYFRYLQKYKAQSLYEVIIELCRFNPELALPASFVNAKRFNIIKSRNFLKNLNDFNFEKRKWESLKAQGWNVQIDTFEIFSNEKKPVSKYQFWEINKEEVVEEKYVFEWIIEMDEENKSLRVYPKYKIQDDILVYTRDEDFEKDMKPLESFQKEIAYFVRDIFGNFVPEPSDCYLSPETMFHMGRIINEEDDRIMIPGIGRDILTNPIFNEYYKLLLSPEDNTLKKLKYEKD